jgi:hypothetical protein
MIGLGSLADPIQDDSIRALLWSEDIQKGSEAGRSGEFRGTGFSGYGFFRIRVYGVRFFRIRFDVHRQDIEQR